MRRWHEDVQLMIARQKFARRYYGSYMQDGLSRWRKRKPLDCGNPRCGICHSMKWGRKRRAAVKRAAIQFELQAEI